VGAMGALERSSAFTFATLGTRAAFALIPMIPVVMAVGCTTLAPSTTVPAPSAPYVAAEDEAVVVFHRRSILGPDVRGGDLTVLEKWSYVRISDGSGQALADVRATEHAVVRVPPGEARFFVRNWAMPPRSRCIGAIAATLERGHVYAVRIEAIASTDEACSHAIRVVPIERSGVEAFFGELIRTRSEQRTFLGENRERSGFVDGEGLQRDVVRAGNDRIARDPVVLAPGDGVPWTAVSNPSRYR
jgi:hypothetical protein